MPLLRKVFKRLQYPLGVTAQCVHWYLAYAHEYCAIIEEMMAERSIHGRRWHMDKTYIKVKGQWRYLYHAVDIAGQTIDFLLIAKRDAAAALHFLRKAIKHQREPEVV